MAGAPPALTRSTAPGDPPRHLAPRSRFLPKQTRPPQSKILPTGGSPVVPVTPGPPSRPLRAPLGHFAPPAGDQKRGRGAGGGRSETPGWKCQNSHQFLVAPVVLVALPIQPLRQQLQRPETHTSDHRAGPGGGRGAAGRGTGEPGERPPGRAGRGRRGRGGPGAAAQHRPGTAPAPAPAPAAEETRS